MGDLKKFCDLCNTADACESMLTIKNTVSLVDDRYVYLLNKADDTTANKTWREVSKTSIIIIIITSKIFNSSHLIVKEKMNGSVAFQFHNSLKRINSVVLPKMLYKNHKEVLKNFFHTSCIQNQVKPKSQNTLNIFDRNSKKLQRERAALLEKPETYDYLKEEVGYRLADRIFDIKRKFGKAIDLGCGRGFVSKHVAGEWVEELIMTDNSELLMSHCVCDDPSVKTKKVVCDEEHLAEVFEPESVDLVVSNLVLHWVNQLPGCFSQVMKILKIDGVFLGCIFGIETLYELRSSLQLAEMERKGGISPHISPFARPTDIGNLLSGAGFVMQTIDVDEIVVRYPTMFELMEDLKGMGENNAAWNRSVHLSRDIILAASVLYEHLYGETKKNEGDTGVPATFQIIYFIGWKPDPSKPQHQSKDPAMVSMRDFYKLDEIAQEGPKKIDLE